VLPLILALGIAAVHLLADRLDPARVIPRPAWLSAASGFSVAFVFVLLMPELQARQEDLRDASVAGWLENHVWLAALAGLVAFYAVEHAILAHGRGRTAATHGAFSAHTAVFALYNALIGYVLFNPHPRFESSLVPYALALAAHLLVVDDAMRRHHPKRYHRVGRWVLASAVVAGAGVGMAMTAPPLAPALALSFLAGGMILNALKEELPDEREGRPLPFMAGALVMALIAVGLYVI
jgi:hypothetical protein